MTWRLKAALLLLAGIRRLAPCFFCQELMDRLERELRIHRKREV